LQGKDKLEGKLNHELSADYNELMKKMSESFRDMHEDSVQYYKQKPNKQLDKLEKNIQSGNKLNAINEKLLADTYLSLAITIIFSRMSRIEASSLTIVSTLKSIVWSNPWSLLVNRVMLIIQP
jgi:uncharacterized protein YaaW (UPF0174 family)